jgi:hypothetical protein
MAYNSSREQVTSTGIRIVGAKAAELVAQAASIQLAPPAPKDLLWLARFRARPRLGTGSAVPAILQCLGDLLRAEWDACPAVTRDTPFLRPVSRFQGISWDVIGEAGAWRGELVWRHPHPVLAGTPCTTHLVIDEQQQVTTIALATAADGGMSGVRGIVGAGQSRPVLLDALRQVASLTSDGWDGSPQMLSEVDVVPFVRDVMLGDHRAWPVAVLAPLEAGGFLVPPEELAADLFGLAPLYVMERHSCTYRLTDAIGDRRLSAYWGALRVYKPEFSCADRSDDHWLLMRDRLDDPFERAALLGQLGQFAVHRLAPIEGVQARRKALEKPVAPIVPVTPPVAAAVDAASPNAVAPVAPVAPSFPVEITGALAELPAAMQLLAAQLSDLSGTISHLVSVNAQLADEVARLRTATAIRATTSNAVERRLGGIEAMLRPVDSEVEHDATGERAEDEGDTGPTLVDIVRQAGSEYGDALLMLESAEVTAAESPYADIDRVGVVLQAMAYVARRRQEGGLDGGLRAAFQELGIDYRSGVAKTTSEKLRRQYHFVGPDGRDYDCPEHIALGSTYDPKHCLRIYFTSRAPSEPRFVIGHVGRHFTVMTST